MTPRLACAFTTQCPAY